MLLGGGAFYLKKRNKPAMNIPPVSVPNYTSSWQPPSLGSTTPAPYYSSAPSTNPGLTRSFLGTEQQQKKPCGCGK